MKFIARKRLCFLLVLTVLLGVLLSTSVTANASTETELEKLIAELPEVSDPMGTEYYFYNQLSDIEKVMYWKMAEATWENPTVSVKGVEVYSGEELNTFAQRALAALMADDPEYHMYWLRSAFGMLDGGEYTVTLDKFPTVSEYHVKKSKARVQQIVETVGMEGDRYSRLRDLLELMHSEMDYNYDLLVRPSTVVQYDDSIFGCLLYDEAVCGGFSDTVKLLCDELEIPCIVVHTTGTFSHAWNFVQMENGQWYCVDAAADEENGPLMGSETERYMNGSEYNSSAYCLVSLYSVFDDFQFPELDKDAYVYSENYAASYHSVDNSFVEPSAKFLYQVNTDGTTCSIVGYEGIQSGDLVIPEKIDGYTITTIGACAFARCVGFTGDLYIPNTVTVIEEGAFYQCGGLSGELHLPDLLQIIKDYAFLGCERLSGSLVLPESLKELGLGAFIRCKGFAGDLFLPNVDSLGDNVFDYCDGFDGTLYLADGVTWVHSIVGDTRFQNVYVNSSNPQYVVYDGVLFSKDMKTLIWCPTGKPGGFTVPDGVETIGVNAFETCSNMTGNLVLPKGLKKIEEYAFFQAGFTGKLIIPDSVETIGQNAFCLTKFTGDLVIPSSVQSIGEGAFHSALFNGTLSLPDSLTRIESFSFGGCPFTGDLIIPETVKTIEQYAFSGCYFGGDLVLHDSLEYIGEVALGGSSSTYDTLCFSNSIDLSKSTVKLEKDAFRWTVLGGFDCNCGGKYVRELLTQATYWQEGLSRDVCSVCAGTRWKTIVKLAPAKPYKIANVVSGVHVYWKAVDGAAKYGVWRSETGKNGTYKWLANPTVPHFTDTKVESGKTYYYKVTAMNSAGTHSEKSEPIGVVYVSTPDITSRFNKAAGITVGWNKIEGATGYAIYRKSYAGTDAWVRVATIEGNSTFTWQDTSVKDANGTVYKYTVRALAGSDMKTLSGCRNAGRTMARLTSRTLNSATKANATSIKCQWTTSSAVTGYEVRFMVGDQVYKTFTVGNYKTGVKTFTGLKAGQTYKIQVRSYLKVDGMGFYSAWSTAKNVTL